MRRPFDIRTFFLIAGAALLGALWAVYNRSLAMPPPYTEADYRPLVWVYFAVPFFAFWGWFVARRAERWWAAFVCFCIYFFAPFVAARYESCVVAQGSFSLRSCFLETTQAQELANAQGHVVFFQVLVIVQVIAALVVALQRARNRSTMPDKSTSPQTQSSVARNS